MFVGSGARSHFSYTLFTVHSGLYGLYRPVPIVCRLQLRCSFSSHTWTVFSPLQHMADGAWKVPLSKLFSISKKWSLSTRCRQLCLHSLRVVVLCLWRFEPIVVVLTLSWLLRWQKPRSSSRCPAQCLGGLPVLFGGAFLLHSPPKFEPIVCAKSISVNVATAII